MIRPYHCRMAKLAPANLVTAAHGHTIGRFERDAGEPLRHPWLKLSGQAKLLQTGQG